MATLSKFKTNAQETVAIRKALTRARIPFKRVYHSANGMWLNIILMKGYRKLEDDAMKVAKSASSRKGQYDGRITIDTAV